MVCLLRAKGRGDLSGCWKYVPRGVRKYSAIAVFLINSEIDLLPAYLTGSLLIVPRELRKIGQGRGVGDRGEVAEGHGPGPELQPRGRWEKLHFLTRPRSTSPPPAQPSPPLPTRARSPPRTRHEGRFPTRKPAAPLARGELSASFVRSDDGFLGDQMTAFPPGAIAQRTAQRVPSCEGRALGTSLENSLEC